MVGSDRSVAPRLIARARPVRPFAQYVAEEKTMYRSVAPQVCATGQLISDLEMWRTAVKNYRISALILVLLLITFSGVSSAQNTPAAPAVDGKKPADQPASPPAPTVLPTPAITGPLQGIPPATLDGGPFGKLAVNGVVNGLGMWTGNYIPGDNATQAGLSNGQVFIQKTDGWFQFYVQAGAYNLPALGTPFLATDKTLTNFYGPVPVAFAKLQAGKNTSFEIGALPTLMGAEYTFTFENMNVERGLLWNQENAVNRGIQANYSVGPLALSVAWNDGLLSNRYTWAWLSAAYTIDKANSVSFVGGGNLRRTTVNTPVTPLFQNNEQIYNVIYTHTAGPWIIQPYLQYTRVPTIPAIGSLKEASTYGGALLVNYTSDKIAGLSLPMRFEYIATTGSATDGSANLMYGPGSKAWSITVTPTYQHKIFFARAEVSFVQASGTAPGAAFGSSGNDKTQTRGIIEAGLLF